MASEREKQLHKAVAKVLSYKRVHMSELTTKRGSAMLYKELTQLGFTVKAPADPEWAFIKAFQVMFQDQNHMPDNIKIDAQLILDVLAFCYVERVWILADGVNYCELAVLKGGEQVVYEKKNPYRRPKTLKVALFKIFSPPVYNESTVDELVGVIVDKAFTKLPYRFQPAPPNLRQTITQVIQEVREIFPILEDYKDLLECVDLFLKFLGSRGICIVRET